MSESALVGEPITDPDPYPGTSETLLLESLRSAGAQQLDPVRFHYLEVLSRRMQAQTGDVRRILEGKLKAALDDYGQRLAQTRKLASPEAHAKIGTPCAPLVQLNLHIRNVTRDGIDSGLVGDGSSGSELRSVRSFRKAWSRISAEDQVDNAIGRGPENAGPLNSHRLVLQSLALMRGLSPDYLRRFLSHVDSLLWLDRANDKHMQMVAKPKPARQSRQKK